MEAIKISRDGLVISYLFFTDDLILFSKASTSQMQVMQHYLDMFCRSYGERINKEKTRLLVSRNINHNVTTEPK